LILFGKKNQELEKLIPKMGEKAPRCWYPILMIIMCIRMVLQAAISFRAVPKAVHIVLSQFDAVRNQKIPCHKSVTRWLTRIGLYKLNHPKEWAEDWALIVDNSVQVGIKKCLVILGVRLNKLQKKALSFEDMEMLAMELHDESSEKNVCQALEKVQQKVGRVVMVCADDGPDLRSGIESFCSKHSVGRVYDTIHKIGTFLKKRFESDSDWQAFSSAAAEAKKKMQQTSAAHLMPPNQRTKSRFLNIEILVRWGIDIMMALETPNHPDKELLEQYCGWVRRYKGLINRLKQFDLISKHVRQHIRENGLCSNTGARVEKLLGSVMELLEFSFEACQYAGSLIDFFVEQSKIVPLGQVWIGSSEIIESLFGKLKCLEQDQHKGGFTALVLGAAACIGSLDVKIVREAMVNIKTRDVEAWADEQLGTTLLSKRRMALGGWRKKKRSKKTGQKSAGVSIGNAVGF